MLTIPPGLKLKNYQHPIFSEQLFEAVQLLCNTPLAVTLTVLMLHTIPTVKVKGKVYPRTGHECSEKE